MKLAGLIACIAISTHAFAGDHGKKASIEPVRNLDLVPLSKLDPEDSKRVSQELTTFLAQTISEDINDMKLKRAGDADKRTVKALECLRDNMDIYLRGANDSGLETFRDAKSAGITPAQFKKFMQTISNSLRFDHNYDE